MNKELVQALWSLKEDATWAYKQALEGHPPDLHGLGLIWKRIEQITIASEHQS